MLFAESSREQALCHQNRCFQALSRVLIRRHTMLFILSIAFFLCTTQLAFARTNDASPALLKAKHSIITVQELARQGLITGQEADKSIAYYLGQASRVAGHQLTLQEVLAIPEPAPQQLTPLQEFAGTLDFLRIILVLGCVATVGAIGYLFRYAVTALLLILKRVPVILYEIIAYTASLGSALGGWFLPEPMHTSLGLAGCLLLAGALGFSASRHSYLANPFRFSTILFLAWTAAALGFASSLIGFIAIGALLSALGFSILITPLCYGFGFRDRATVGRTTLAAFLILIFFIALRLLGTRLPALAIFDFGALFLGSFVGYTGLLISASRWYKSQKKYWTFQIITIVAGLGALFAGSVFHIDELLKIGGTFFVLYCLEKMMEIPTKNRPAFALLCAGVGMFTIGFCWFALIHPAIFQAFLFMPQ